MSIVKTGIGQDSHSFEETTSSKPLYLGGVHFQEEQGLKGNSDADVVLHALTNGISTITGVNILGKIADEMCKDGVVDSRFYLAKALEYLKKYTITHVAFSIECSKPKISPRIDEMKASIASLLSITKDDVGITATTGENLTPFGQRKGIQVFCIVTAQSN